MPSQEDMATMQRVTRLNQVGVEQPATIRTMQATGRSDVGGGQEYSFDVEVQPAGGAPYPATFTQYMHVASMGSWAYDGAAVNVRVDPQDPHLDDALGRPSVRPLQPSDSGVLGRIACSREPRSPAVAWTVLGLRGLPAGGSSALSAKPSSDARGKPMREARPVATGERGGSQTRLARGREVDREIRPASPDGSRQIVPARSFATRAPAACARAAASPDRSRRSTAPTRAQPDGPPARSGRAADADEAADSAGDAGVGYVDQRDVKRPSASLDTSAARRRRGRP